MDVRISLNTTIFRKKNFIVNGELIHYLRRMNLRKLRVLILQKWLIYARVFLIIYTNTQKKKSLTLIES